MQRLREDMIARFPGYEQALAARLIELGCSLNEDGTWNDEKTESAKKWKATPGMTYKEYLDLLYKEIFHPNFFKKPMKIQVKMDGAPADPAAMSATMANAVPMGGVEVESSASESMMEQ